MASTEQQIDDAVAKRHIQNTDTALGIQSADLDMNLHKVIGLKDPTGDKDAAHKKYVDDHGGGGGSGNVNTFGSPLDNDFAKFTDPTHIEGRSYVEVRADLNVEDGATADQDANEIVSLINAGAGLIDDDNIAASIARDTEVDAKVSDVIYGASWNGVTGIAPSKNAIYDKIESMGIGYTNLTQFVDQTAWRLFYSNAAGDVTELALGTSGQYLKANGVGAVPTWSVPGGEGNVVGPATNTDNYVPQWNGADSKTLKNGFPITAAGKALIDDADAAAQRTTLGLLSAVLRNAEDALTDGSNLPDGHAIKTYGDANWGGGGSSKWTDAGAYYFPNNWSYFRIHDINRLDIADSVSYGSGFPWNDEVPYPGSNAGSMLCLGQTSSTDGNPPLWVQKRFNKSGSGNYHHAGAGHFEVWKQTGSIGSAVSCLTGNIVQDASSGDAIGIHGRAIKKGVGNTYAGWFYGWRAAGSGAGGYLHGIEVDISNRQNNETFADTVTPPGDMAGWFYSQDSTFPSLACIAMGADSSTNTFFNGILFDTNAVRADGAGINMASISPLYGIRFGTATTHLYCNSGNLKFYDPVTGAKTLAELAAGGGGGLNNVVEDTTPELGGILYTNAYDIRMENAHPLFMKNSSGSYIMGINLNSGNTWQVACNGQEVSFGPGCGHADPILIRVGGVDNKRIVVGATDSGGSGYRMLRVTN